MRFSQPERRAHRGLTLMELVVVLMILVALAGLAIPLLTNLTSQSSTATNASILQGINEGMGRFEAQYNAVPTAWDGVLNDTQAGLYSKLHPNLTPLIVAQKLSAPQIKSLVEAGLKGVHFQQEAWTGQPSDSGQTYVTLVDFATGLPVADAGSWCVLVKPDPANFQGHNIDFPDRAFSINKFKSKFAHDFVVVGFGAETSLKGSVMSEAPVFQSAQPKDYYARALCVFMVPGAGQTYFRAQYVGCFAPNGTCIQDNVNTFYSSQQSPN